MGDPRTIESDDWLLKIRDLRVQFRTDAGLLNAVDGVSFDIAPSETIALVGESGSGKSVTALSILQIVGTGGRMEGARVDGEILFRQRDGSVIDLLGLSLAEMRAIRGNQISMIFQEPMTSLNPVLTVGDQLTEAIILHQGDSRKDALAKASEALALVGLPDSHKQLSAYPHQLSGGMRQRVMIAISLSCNPRLLIADEPTTALDVTIQAQILQLIRRLQGELGMAVLFITHDLGVVAQTARSAVVMYAGRVVEQAEVDDIFFRPLHPYTAGLLGSIPQMMGSDKSLQALKSVSGNVPDMMLLPPGCSFHPRCPGASLRRCSEELPPVELVESGRRVRCWRWRELAPKFALDRSSV